MHSDTSAENLGEQCRLRAVRRYDILDTPPDGAFDRITRIAAKLFRTPIAIVSIVDEDRIWFKSHHGLDVTQIPRSPGLCASAILGDHPWVLTDASADPRSLTNPLVAGAFGLRFYVGVPLRTNDGFNLGTLCVIDHHPRAVEDRQLEILKELAGIVMDELELRLVARNEVRQRETLLNELHHRVKNNLQVVSSILSLQARNMPADARLPFEESVRRIGAISFLHEQFYRGSDVSEIDITSFLHALGSAVANVYELSSRVNIKIQGPRVGLPIQRATPLSLLLSEVVSNACKHAFPGSRAGCIEITISAGHDEISVIVADDGIGRSALSKSVNGMGSLLIRSLSVQLNGIFEYRDRVEGGTVFQLRIPQQVVDSRTH